MVVNEKSMIEGRYFQGWNRSFCIIINPQLAMAVDNPFYFSLSSEAAAASSSSSSATAAAPTTLSLTKTTSRAHNNTATTSFSNFFRRQRPSCKKMGAAASSSSVVSGSTTSTLVHNESSGRSSGASSTPTTPTEEREPMLPKNNGTPLPAATGNLSPAQRRSFRNLFRSISANSDHGKCRQFLKGDPRGPSDVAPPSPHTPHRSHSHSENDRRRPKRNRRVLKSTSELLSNDMVFCGKDVTDHHHHFDQDENEEDEDDEDHEVFLGIDDARYYNLSATLPNPRSTSLGQRRHSIGTFLGKDRNPSANTTVLAGIKVTQGTSLVEPDVPAPPVPVEATREEKKQRSGNKSRRKGHKDSSSKGGSRSATMLSKVEAHAEDDVVFVSSKESEASSLWVSYLTACFEQISRQQGRPPFKVRHVTVEESIPPGIEEKVKSARLQIIVVCPVLLERVIGRPENATSLSRHLIVDRVLAMMLGVQEDHVTESHRAALVTYNQWRKFFVKDQDETFVGEFLGAAVAILGTTPPSALRNDKTAFTVHPKKVKLGHNKVIVLLNDPLRPEDNVTVIVDRCGEGINITHVKRRNPYTLQFSIPERCLEMSMLVGVRIFKNDCPLGVKQVKCESRLRELDQILRAHDNPLEFICQTFGFNPGDREQLDNWMVHAFQKNVPPHFSLLSTPSGLVPTHRNHISPEENPTLLHFAARFGLERLAWQLLDCPGGDLACDLKNIAEMTPADLAEQAGHHRLAHQLRGYMQMNEFTNMYSYLKGISETAATPTSHTSSNEHHSSTTNHQHQPQQGSDNATNDQEDYCRPRPLSEAYSVPPAARPITTLISPCQLSSSATNSSINTAIDMNYSIVPTPTPVMSTTTNGIDVPQGYMKMHPVGPKLASSTSNVFVQQPLNNYRTTTPIPQLSRQNSHFDDNNPPTSSSTISLSSTRTVSSSTTKSSSATGDSSAPRDELLEIINDFKNNVFTISEVEKLVENWRNRNDVQQSFKDKQRQLTAMREEYERIQKKMKEEMKAPTPFDRIKKFFSKGKKDTKDSNTTNTNDDSSGSNITKSDTVNGGLSDRRPVSSLSLHSVSSSSSSGRMSTVSRCSGTSLGDSGTHSDPEDRRLQNREENKSGVMSYEIPPAPKPFTGSYSPTLRYTPSPRSSSTSNDLELRSSHTLIRTGNTEYYIAYPPSGLPIHTFKPDGTMREPKTPCTPIESPHNNFPESFMQLGNTKENNINNNVNSNSKSNAETEGYANVNIPSSSSSANLENTENSGSNSGSNNSINHNISKEVKETSCNEANRQDEGGNYVNVDPAVPMPVPPLPLVPPPGMCIPTDYMNVAPMIKDPSPANNELQERASSINSENIEESRSRSPNEYVRAHVTNQDCQGIDVVDSSNPMHEYMNLGGPQQQEQVRIVGSLPKKSPAPPVPPRIVTKK